MAVHALYVAHKVVQIVQEGRGKAQGVENGIEEAGVAQVDQGGNGRGQIRRGGAREEKKLGMKIQCFILILSPLIIKILTRIFASFTSKSSNTLKKLHIIINSKPRLQERIIH